MATKINRTAIDAFIAKKAEIDEMLARITALSEDHFEIGPDDVHWGHVGNLTEYAVMLKRITDIAFNEGECAG